MTWYEFDTIIVNDFKSYQHHFPEFFNRRDANHSSVLTCVHTRALESYVKSLENNPNTLSAKFLLTKLTLLTEWCESKRKTEMYEILKQCMIHQHSSVIEKEPETKFHRSFDLPSVNEIVQDICNVPYSERIFSVRDFNGADFIDDKKDSLVR